jgi:hypothetical protein
MATPSVWPRLRCVRLGAGRSLVRRPEERGLVDRNPMSINKRRRKLRGPGLRRAGDSHRGTAARSHRTRQRRRVPTSGPSLRRPCDAHVRGPSHRRALSLRWRDVHLAAGRLRVAIEDRRRRPRGRAAARAARGALGAQGSARPPASRARVREQPWCSSESDQRPTADSPTHRQAREREPRRGEPLTATRGAHAASFRRTYASVLFAIGRTAPRGDGAARTR